MVQKLKAKLSSMAKFSLEQGKLLYKGRLVLSDKSRFILALLTTFHDSVLGGHSSSYKRINGCPENYIGRE